MYIQYAECMHLARHTCADNTDSRQRDSPMEPVCSEVVLPLLLEALASGKSAVLDDTDEPLDAATYGVALLFNGALLVKLAADLCLECCPSTGC